jgi:hypothetical protein
MIGAEWHPLSEAQAKHTSTLEKKLGLSGTRREDWWPEDEGEHEVSFAFDPFTLEVTRFAGDRGAADGWKKTFDPRKWVTGSIDWLAGAHVDDLKTGDFPVIAATSRQLRTYQCLPWLEAGTPKQWEEPVSITQWPKYPLGGRPKRNWHYLNYFDMHEQLEDLRWTLTHPGEVNVIDTTYDEDGRFDKMSPCLFCECREPHPASGWMENWLYRTMPMCMPGLVKRIERTE